MNAGELELYPTQDLIDELLRRTTFQGVVIHAVEETRTKEWVGERSFAVRHNANLCLEEACRLLSIISEHIAGRE